MAKEQPADYFRVRPYFWELGFGIVYIEQAFAFPEATARAMKDSGLDIGVAPEPEIILGRNADNKALYIEAKADSFGIESSNCRQARAHLVACGPAFGEVFTPLTDCLLCYLIPEEGCALMPECLATLSAKLSDLRLTPGAFSCNGLRLRATEIQYFWDEAFKSHTGSDVDKITLLGGVTDDTDPTPLVLVFTDDDCCDETKRDFYRQVVIRQVHACLLCDLHELPVGSPYEKSPDDLLMKTTDKVFGFMGRQRQKNLRRLIRGNIFRKVSDYWKEKQLGVKLTGDKLEVSWSTTQEKDDFLDWLEDRTQFDTAKPPDDELPLLKDLKDRSFEA